MYDLNYDQVFELLCSFERGDYTPLGFDMLADAINETHDKLEARLFDRIPTITLSESELEDMAQWEVTHVEYIKHSDVKLATSEEVEELFADVFDDLCAKEAFYRGIEQTEASICKQISAGTF